MKALSLNNIIAFFVFICIHAITSCNSVSSEEPQINTLSFPNKLIDSFPKPIGYVNDFAGLYTPEQKLYLDKILAEFDSTTTIQIAVLTTDSLFLNNQAFDDYTLRLANYWGIGHAEKDNGILVGINLKIRYMRIQNGFGIEQFLSDVETKEIIDSAFTPQFKKGNFYAGTLKGLEEIKLRLQRNKSKKSRS